LAPVASFISCSHSGVIDRLDDLFVVEVGGCGLAVDQDEPLAVERQAALDRARIVDGDAVFLILGVAHPDARRRVVIVGVRLFRQRRREIDRRLDALEVCRR
jgi:hypothetical protein